MDECYYCKLCFNHCPYTPPHQYGIDFPLLMAIWKKRLAAERGTRWRDWLLTRTDLLGRLNSACAPLVNWGLAQGWVRQLMQSLLGVHRERQVLHYQRETFVRWWGQWGEVASPRPGRRWRCLPAVWSTISPLMSAKRPYRCSKKQYSCGVAGSVVLRDAVV